MAKILIIFHSETGHRVGGHFGPVSVGAPNQERRGVCEEFGARIARLVMRLTEKG